MNRIENTFRVGNDCVESCRISIVERMAIVGVERQRISTAAEYANGIPVNSTVANCTVGIDVALDCSSWEIFSICLNSF